MTVPKLRVVVLIAVAVLGASCSGARIVNTGDPPAATPASTSTTPSPPPSSNAHLANAFDYVPQGRAGYFFTTPSGRWACAIVTRVKAGCQSAAKSGSALGITGEPESVPSAAGEPTTPNAIVVNREGDAQFVALEEPEFLLEFGPANVLPFNRILAAAGFRCNVQEQFGVSCVSEVSGKGFTFSAEGFTPQYTDVPPNAP